MLWVRCWHLLLGLLTDHTLPPELVAGDHLLDGPLGAPVGDGGVELPELQVRRGLCQGPPILYTQRVSDLPCTTRIADPLTIRMAHRDLGADAAVALRHDHGAKEVVAPAGLRDLEVGQLPVVLESDP